MDEVLDMAQRTGCVLACLGLLSMLGPALVRAAWDPTGRMRATRRRTDRAARALDEEADRIASDAQRARERAQRRAAEDPAAESHRRWSDRP